MFLSNPEASLRKFLQLHATGEMNDFKKTSITELYSYILAAIISRKL